MYLSFFMEIDANQQAKYKKEFLETVEYCKKIGGGVIGSKEYIDTLSEPVENFVWEIPEEVMEKISSDLEHDWDREYLLMIRRNEALEKWLLEFLGHMSIEVVAILCNGEYVSLEHVAHQANLKVYREFSRPKEGQGMCFYRCRYNELSEEKMEDLQKQLKETADELDSTKTYLHNLEVNATNLDIQMHHYKAFYDENGEKMEALEKENKRYLDLYNDAMKELDKVRIECLDLKKMGGKHQK